MRPTPEPQEEGVSGTAAPLGRWRRVPWDVATVGLAFALFPVTLVVEEAVPTNPFGSEATILGSAWLAVLATGTWRCWRNGRAGQR